MSELKYFDLATLQLRHPDAFFLKLRYSRFKFNALQNLQFVIAINLLSLLICVACSISSVLLEYYFFKNATIAFNVTLIMLMALLYPYICYAQYQAQFSSKAYSQRLQNCLYLQIPIFLVLLLNLYVIHSDMLVIISMIILALSSFGAVTLEPLFKSSCSAIDQIKLQKLRQLAFWAYQQSRSKTPQPIQDQSNLQAYYQNLYQQCMHEEQKLLSSIRFKNFKDYFYR
ncbi:MULTISPECIES: hypothetical protein [Acinetobacter]|uniref:hypothetical protein n=1 Tax=Acinetobacter TaxID=469 RepID=UPI0015D445A7|nr:MULTISPECIES: hypothetical protein [Acinetobacter]MCO8090705.1 hypothetical protein [Acinetobacter pseudolwoffii]MDM1335096.1 hypothetical protein [Acinetobacter pseudolwoffii]